MTTDGGMGGTSTRGVEHSLREWFLLEGNRFWLAVLGATGAFITFVAVVTSLAPPFADQIAETDTIDTLFSTMITVIVTGATLVVTIGQLVLTQENGPLGDQRERMRNSMMVREETADVIESPAPTDPAAFLDAILAATIRQSESLREGVRPTGSEDLQSDVTDLVEDVEGNASAVRDALQSASFGSFDVLSAALGFDYSTMLARVERILANHDHELDDDTAGTLAALERALTLYGPAREHVKTLYFQWSLIDLSKHLLYVAVPAVLVAAAMVAVVDTATAPGVVLGVDAIVLLVGGAFAVTVFPFLLFVSYILRILTVAKRTLSIEPLTLVDR